MEKEMNISTSHKLTLMGVAVAALIAHLSGRLISSSIEALLLLQWYVQEHLLFCLVPALFIAGAVTVFIDDNLILRHLGPEAKPLPAYGVASVSGSVLSVCSCTVLPLYAGIYRMGAGLGPAVSFLYSGPAINVMAVVVTASVLGSSLGIARALYAILFSIVIGITMQLLFRREKSSVPSSYPEDTQKVDVRQFITPVLLILLLVLATWGKGESAFSTMVYTYKWHGVIITALAITGILIQQGASWRIAAGTVVAATATSFLFTGIPEAPFLIGIAGFSLLLHKGTSTQREWFRETMAFSRLILPLLLGGVLAAGLLLGRPGHEALIPSQWITHAVGGDSILTTLMASLTGSLMYFATLTEIPIVQGLTGAGMGKGPALSLLLAGPAVSLPNILVMRTIMGTRKTAAYIMLVVAASTVAGWMYGTFF